MHMYELTGLDEYSVLEESSSDEDDDDDADNTSEASEAVLAGAAHAYGEYHVLGKTTEWEDEPVRDLHQLCSEAASGSGDSVRFNDAVEGARVEKETMLAGSSSASKDAWDSVHWNQMYQYALDLDDNRSGKFALLTSLYSSFRTACEQYSRVIISELSLPVRKRTIKPASDGEVGGLAGGTKFVVNGILFKIPTDPDLGNGKHLFSGHKKPSWERAAKGAGHDLKGANTFLEAVSQDADNPSNLRVPLQIVLDYSGFRMLAMPFLPLAGESLVYGSSDGGRTVHKDDPEIDAGMRAAGKYLHLAPHLVGRDEGTKVKMYTAGDVEAHAGADGRPYALDFGRLMPPEAPGEAQHLPPTKPSVFFRMLRPEFLQYCKRLNMPALNPDAFTRWIAASPMETVTKHHEDVRSATRHLITTVAPEFAQYLRSAIEEGSEHEWVESLVEEAHKRGINMRHLGLVRLCVMLEDFGELMFTPPEPELPVVLEEPEQVQEPAVAKDVPQVVEEEEEEDDDDDGKEDDEDEGKDNDDDDNAEPPQPADDDNNYNYAADLDALAGEEDLRDAVADREDDDEAKEDEDEENDDDASSVASSVSSISPAEARRRALRKRLEKPYFFSRYEEPVQLAPSRASDVLLVELVKRAIKNLLREELRGVSLGLNNRSAKTDPDVSANQALVRLTTVRFLRLICSEHSPESATFYEHHVYPAITARFGLVAVKDIRPSRLRHAPALRRHLRHIVDYVLAAVGLQLSPSFVRDLETTARADRALVEEDADAPLDTSTALSSSIVASLDVVEAQPRVKEMGILALAEGRMLLSEAVELLDADTEDEGVDRSVVRLVELALSRIDQGLNNLALPAMDRARFCKCLKSLARNGENHDSILTWLQNPRIAHDPALVLDVLHGVLQNWSANRKIDEIASYGGPLHRPHLPLVLEMFAAAYAQQPQLENPDVLPFVIQELENVVTWQMERIGELAKVLKELITISIDTTEDTLVKDLGARLLGVVMGDSELMNVDTWCLNHVLRPEEARRVLQQESGIDSAIVIERAKGDPAKMLLWRNVVSGVDLLTAVTCLTNAARDRDAVGMERWLWMGAPPTSLKIHTERSMALVLSGRRAAALVDDWSQWSFFPNGAAALRKVALYVQKNGTIPASDLPPGLALATWVLLHDQQQQERLIGANYTISEDGVLQLPDTGRFTSADFNVAAAGIGASTRIVELDASSPSSHVSDDFLSALVLELSEESGLRGLILRGAHNHVSDPLAEELALLLTGAVPPSSTSGPRHPLTHLDLGHTTMSSRGIESVLAVSDQCTSLERLSVAGQTLAPASGSNLSSLLRNPVCKLTFLDLSGCQLSLPADFNFGSTIRTLKLDNATLVAGTVSSIQVGTRVAVRWTTGFYIGTITEILEPTESSPRKWKVVYDDADVRVYPIEHLEEHGRIVDDKPHMKITESEFNQARPFVREEIEIQGGNSLTMTEAMSLVAGLPKLEELHVAGFLRSSTEDEQVLRSFVQMLHQQVQLKRLDVSGNAFASATAREIMEAFSEDHNVEYLNLGDVELDVAGARAAAAFVERQPQLSHLGFDTVVRRAMVGLCLDAARCEALFGFSSTLKLGADGSDPEAMLSACLDLLAASSFGEQLEVQQQSITTVVAESLQRVLEQNRTIVAVRLQGCTLGDGVPAILAAALEKNQYVQQLSLRDSKLKPEDLKLVLNAAVNQGRISSIDLSGCGGAAVLIGTRVAVEWAGKRFYTGEVDDFEDGGPDKQPRYHVFYDDNDRRWYDLDRFSQLARIVQLPKTRSDAICSEADFLAGTPIPAAAVGSIDFLALAEFVRNAAALKTLVLGAVTTSAPDAKAFASAVAASKTLADVQVESELVAAMMALHGKSETGATEIDLSGVDVTLEVLDAMTNSFVSNSSVSVLNLGAARVDEGLTATLADAVNRSPHLQKVLMSSQFSSVMLALKLSEPSRSLTLLGVDVSAPDVSDEQLTEEEFAMLCRAVEASSTVSSLALGDNVGNVARAKQLMEMACGHGTLRSLHLSALGTTLALCHTQGAAIPDWIEASLGSRVEFGKDMATADVSACMQLLGQGGCPFVRQVCVSERTIDVEMSGALVQLLQRAGSRMESLDVSECAINEEARDTLVACLSSGNSLKRLSVAALSTSNASAALIGRAVAVVWYGNTYYTGEVTEVSLDRGDEPMYKVSYHDGDVRWYDMATLKTDARLIEPSAQNRTSCSREEYTAGLPVSAVGFAGSGAVALPMDMLCSILRSQTQLEAVDVGTRRVSVVEVRKFFDTLAALPALEELGVDFQLQPRGLAAGTRVLLQIGVQFKPCIVQAVSPADVWWGDPTFSLRFEHNGRVVNESASGMADRGRLFGTLPEGQDSFSSEDFENSPKIVFADKQARCETLVGAIAEGLRACGRLHRLRLGNVAVGEADARMLCDVLLSCTQLESLGLHLFALEDRLGEAELACLVDVLRNHPRLEAVDLGPLESDLAGAMLVRDALASNDRLKSVSLDNWLLKTLSVLHTLEVEGVADPIDVDMRDCPASFRDRAQVCEALSKSDASLPVDEIYVSSEHRNETDSVKEASAAVRALLPFVRKSRVLKALHLGKVDLSVAVASELAAAVAESPSLSVLSATKPQTHALIAMFGQMHSPPHKVFVGATDTTVAPAWESAEELHALASALEKTKCVANLFISSVDISAADVLVLSRALRASRSLRSVDCRSPFLRVLLSLGMSDPSRFAALFGADGLTDLGPAQLSDEQFAQFVSLLKQNSSVEVLNLRGAVHSRDRALQFVEAAVEHPRLKTLHGTSASAVLIASQLSGKHEVRWCPEISYELDLWGVSLDQATLEALGDYLEESHDVQTLLVSQAIPLENAKPIGVLLRRARQVRDVRLGSMAMHVCVALYLNNIGRTEQLFQLRTGVNMGRSSNIRAEGLIACLEALKENTEMATVSLAGQDLTPEVVASLTSMLSVNRTVHQLDLSQCTLAAHHQLLSALRDNQHLQVLVLNGIENLDVNEFALGLAQHPVLRSVSLSPSLGGAVELRVGTRLAVTWAGPKYYTGTITEVHPEADSPYHVLYDDGDRRVYGIEHLREYGRVVSVPNNRGAVEISLAEFEAGQRIDHVVEHGALEVETVDDVSGIVALVQRCASLRELRLGALQVSYAASKQIAECVQTSALESFQSQSALLRTNVVLAMSDDASRTNAEKMGALQQLLQVDHAVVELNSASVAQAEIEEIMQRVGRSTLISELNLGSMELDVATVDAIVGAAKKCQSLERISLESPVDRAIVAVALSDVSRSSALVGVGAEVDLEDAEMSTEQLALLCHVLPSNETTQVLKLPGALRTAEDAKLLGRALKDHRSVRLLELPAAATLLLLSSLGDELAECPWAPPLESTLDVRGVDMDAAWVEGVAGVLSQTTDVKALVIGRAVDLERARSIATLLQAGTSITLLDAGAEQKMLVGVLLNDLERGGMLCGVVDELDLSEVEHFEPVLEALRESSVVKTVSLRRRALTMQAVQALAACESVKHLKLGGCSLAGDAAEAMQQAVMMQQVVARLEVLDVGVQLTSSSLLAACAAASPSVHKLDLSGLKLQASNLALGVRVTVLWFGRRWYKGTLDKIEQRDGELQYHIHYDDDDKRWYTMEAMKQYAKVLSAEDESVEHDVVGGGSADVVDRALELVAACKKVEELSLRGLEAEPEFFVRLSSVVGELSALKALDVRGAGLDETSRSALEAARGERWVFVEDE